MSRFLTTFLIVVFLTGILAGCGGKVEETYIMTTLREATRGSILSPGFKFGFDTPKFISTHKNLALVREGNLIEFFTGRDIENKSKLVEGKKFTLGARKIFNPVVHFTVDFMVSGGDTVRVGEPYEVSFPTLMKKFEYDTEGFEEVDLDALTSNTRLLKPIFNTSFLVKNGKVAYEEIPDPKGKEPSMEFTLRLKNVRFVIDDLSDEMQLILKALINENLYFEGGVSYGSRPTTSQKYRKANDLGGKVKVDFIKYGNLVVMTQV
ncbi:MAG: hypothetical protein KAX38_00600 [Candidatus Krumholzibacteria bacterium]|nr:hypothetical protein [Candidatus Krumholzibacteria bacterium]